MDNSLKSIRVDTEMLSSHFSSILVLVDRNGTIKDLVREIERTLRSVFPLSRFNRYPIRNIVTRNHQALLPPWLSIEPLLCDNEEVALCYDQTILGCDNELFAAIRHDGHNLMQSQLMGQIEPVNSQDRHFQQEMGVSMDDGPSRKNELVCGSVPGLNDLCNVIAWKLSSRSTGLYPGEISNGNEPAILGCQNTSGANLPYGQSLEPASLNERSEGFEAFVSDVVAVRNASDSTSNIPQDSQSKVDESAPGMDGYSNNSGQNRVQPNTPEHQKREQRDDIDQSEESMSLLSKDGPSLMENTLNAKMLEKEQQRIPLTEASVSHTGGQVAEQDKSKSKKGHESKTADETPFKAPENNSHYVKKSKNTKEGVPTTEKKKEKKKRKSRAAEDNVMEFNKSDLGSDDTIFEVPCNKKKVQKNRHGSQTFGPLTADGKALTTISSLPGPSFLYVESEDLHMSPLNGKIKDKEFWLLYLMKMLF
eukprot:gene9450-10439_t